MIAKAHEISLEAGSKMATAMKDVIFAAAGLTPFAIESAKDLVNYMVRRAQMSAEEADRIIREIEAAAPVRKPTASEAAASPSAPKKSAAAKEPAAKAAVKKEPAAKKEAAPSKEPAVKKAPAAKKAPALKKAPAAKKVAAKK